MISLSKNLLFIDARKGGVWGVISTAKNDLKGISSKFSLQKFWWVVHFLENFGNLKGKKMTGQREPINGCADILVFIKICDWEYKFDTRWVRQISWSLFLYK